MTGRHRKKNDWGIQDDRRENQSMGPGLLIDLIKRSVQVEPAERQELHQMTEKQRTQNQIKQDEIPQTDKPGTGRGYYLFIEDDAGCMIEQQGGQVI